MNWTTEQELYKEGLSKSAVHKWFKKCPTKIIDGEKCYDSNFVEKVLENPNNQKKIQKMIEQKQELNPLVRVNEILDDLEKQCDKLKTIPFEQVKADAIKEEADYRGYSINDVIDTYDKTLIDYITFKFIRHHRIDGQAGKVEEISKLDINGYKLYKKKLCEKVTEYYPELKRETKHWLADDRRKNEKAFSVNPYLLDEARGTYEDTVEQEEYVLNSPNVLEHGRISLYNQDGQLINTYRGISELMKKLYRNQNVSTNRVDAEKRKIFNCLKNEMIYNSEQGKSYICKLVRNPEKLLDFDEVTKHKQNTELYNDLKHIVRQGRMDHIWHVFEDVIYFNNSKSEINMFPPDQALQTIEDYFEKKAHEYFVKTGEKYQPQSKTEKLLFEDYERER